MPLVVFHCSVLADAVPVLPSIVVVGQEALYNTIDHVQCLTDGLPSNLTEVQ